MSGEVGQGMVRWGSAMQGENDQPEKVCSCGAPMTYAEVEYPSGVSCDGYSEWMVFYGYVCQTCGATEEL
ncbi:MAG TPA: hypothetical protein VFV58_39285 [Blastocatellia bacterium]|jgi:hypothetical protein|nr:hypothetical protein [Blastocatellia bacterium]